MLKRAFRSAVMLVAAMMPVAAVQADAREQQWIYRELVEDGRDRPTAIFLSWDYSAVVFTATCDSDNRELVLRYYPAPDIPEAALASFALRLGETPMVTKREPQFVEGRAPLSNRLAKAMREPGELTIDAPNDMGEPWHVGEAKPLRRLALACK